MPFVVDGPGGGRVVALFDIDPDLVARRVLACPGVAGLSAGPWGAAVTYLPGRRVTGVRLSPAAVEVHLIARYGPSVGELAGQVRAALAGQVGGRQVDIVVEELADPGAPPPLPGTARPGLALPLNAPAPATRSPALPAAVVASSAAPVAAPATAAPPTAAPAAPAATPSSVALPSVEEPGPAPRRPRLWRRSQR